MSRIRGVILDVDGTLVDSNDAHAEAWTEALRRGGYDVSFEKIRRMIGMGSDKLLSGAVGVEKDSAEGKRMSESWKEIFHSTYLPKLTAFPDVVQLLGRMRDTGLKLVVASSSEEEELKQLLKIAGANDYIESHTSSDDADESKPSPDIVQAALAEIGLDPSEVLMLGDTPYDIEAARLAGIGTIALRCGGWSDDELKGAVAVYDAPADLLEHFERSPLAAESAQ